MITTWECDKGRKIMHLVTSQVNQIISGTYRPRSFSYKLSEFEMALGVYNRASHWMLLVADISTATLFFYNPVEEHALEMEMVLSGWKDFIEFYIEKTEDSLTLEWTVTSKPHVQQMDSYNCGVFCLIFAEKHLQSASMLHIDHTDLIEMRKKVAMKLMLFEEFLTDCCPKCGCDVKNDEKMQCVSCCRYYHFKEFCIKDDLDELDGASSQFICKLCRIDFWPKERLSESVPLCENMVQWTDKYEVTTKLKQSVKDVDNAIEITFVSDYNKEECAQGDHHTNTAYKKEDVDNSSRHERKMKSKRRSYIYPPIKRVKKTYCLCKRPNDGELYWQCALCKDWFHPECIGMQPDDEPTEYVCSVCEIQPSSETDTPKEGIKNEGEGYEIPEDLQISDEEEGMEDTFFVCADLACKYLETAITRIQSVLSVAGNASKKPWMVNHYSFRNGCRANKRGFGFSVFSFRAVECVRYHLKKKFFKYDYRGAYQRCGQVIGLRDRKLLKMFDEDIFLAEIYIDEVLLRESLVAILQSITGAQYAEANQECRDVLSKSETKAMKDGLALSAKKKIELEQKYM